MEVTRIRALRGIDELLGQLEGAPADGFLAVLEGDLVDAFIDRACGMAEVHRAAGLRLQGDGGVFEHVRERKRLALHDRVEFADGREQRAQAGFETGQPSEGVLVASAADDRLDTGVPAPEIGAAKSADARDFHQLLQGSTVPAHMSEIPRIRLDRSAGVGVSPCLGVSMI